MARAAEDVGFDSIWLGDHLLYRDDGRPERGPWDAWTLLAALAGVTERVVLGPLVACLAFHPPGLIARMAAAIDEISGGRFVLGVGSGWNEAEFRAFGLPFDHRASRFLESFEIVRRLLAGERVTSDGPLLAGRGRRPPPSPGAQRRRSCSARAVRDSSPPRCPTPQSWNTWWDQYGNTAEGFATLNAGISAAAQSAGRDPAEVERSACVLVSLDPAARARPHNDDAPPLDGQPRAHRPRLCTTSPRPAPTRPSSCSTRSTKPSVRGCARRARRARRASRPAR